MWPGGFVMESVSTSFRKDNDIAVLSAPDSPDGALATSKPGGPWSTGTGPGRGRLHGAATEDRYPDHFGLAYGINGGGSDLARAAVADRHAGLPHHQVVLSHDVAANADFLAKPESHM